MKTGVNSVVCHVDKELKKKKNANPETLNVWYLPIPK